MKITTYKWSICPGKWFARLEDGFWYGDSDPVSEGCDTPQQAVADLLLKLHDISNELVTFLKDPVIERGVDQA